MNKKTASLLNKVAQVYKTTGRKVRKAWYKLTDKERAKERRMLKTIVKNYVPEQETPIIEPITNETTEPIRTDV